MTAAAGADVFRTSDAGIVDCGAHANREKRTFLSLARVVFTGATIGMPLDVIAIGSRRDQAAARPGMKTPIISRSDWGRLPEFDALFVRETTSVNHYTYRFSRRAAAEGLVVIDDPDSILRCSNKVYLAELLSRHAIPTPKTMIIHRDNVNRIVPDLGLPCVLDRQPLYACRYLMAPGHWQVIKRAESKSKQTEGATIAVSMEEAPAKVVEAAVRAAIFVGDGLYGVDVKEIDGRSYAIEVNENPDFDTRHEDSAPGDAVYERIMSVFRTRIEARRHAR